MGFQGPKKLHAFSKEQIENELEYIFHFSDLKSKKWTNKRFYNTFEELLREVDPRFKMTAKIKLEPMGKRSDGTPKPPRLLIADGDEGQIMALFCVSIFERLLVRKWKKRTIKGRSGREAINDVISYLRPS